MVRSSPHYVPGEVKEEIVSRRSRGEEGRNGFNEGVKLNSALFLGFLLLYDMKPFLFYLKKKNNSSFIRSAAPR